MGILRTGDDIVEGDFINESEQNADPTQDADRVARIESNGLLSGVFIPWFCGDGSDGDFDIDGSNTYSGILSKSGSNYTMLRDVYADDFEIPSGSTLDTAGYRLFVRGRIFGEGTVFNNGANGSNASGQTGGAGGAAVSGYFNNVAGGVGGTGGTGGNSSTGGSPAVDVLHSASEVDGAAGGRGGGENDGSPPADAGNAGTATACEQKFGIMRFLTLMGIDLALTGAVESTSAEEDTGGESDDFAEHSHTYLPAFRIINAAAGSGGGQGGHGFGTSGNGTGGGGGGGGANGGIVFICAREWAGTFTIEATGGDGGDGDDAVAGNAGGGGGGAGGSGGLIVVIYIKKTWTGSTDVTAGSGGSAGSDLGGVQWSATAGGNGTAGLVVQVKLQELL